MDKNESPEPPPPLPAGAPENDAPAVRVLLLPANVWRICLVVLGAVGLFLLLRFLVTDAGSLFFTLIIAWFISLAMEPAVRKLSRWMSRSLSTLLVILTVVAALVAFMALFGQLFVEQVAQMLRALPDVVTATIDWVNERFDTAYEASDILASLQISPEQVAQYAQGVLGGVLGLLGTVVGAVFGLLTLGLFTFYLSADGPRLRRWLARLLPLRYRPHFENVWELSLLKTGGYVAARLTLASINAASSTVFFLLIGLPSWLALGIWTGVVAQLIPTIGTYIAIALPVLVGLVSPSPWLGVAALAFGVAYQQVENLILEPRISAKAVNIHPGVAFGSVILGASLYGAGGALLAIPVMAMLLAVLDAYVADRQDASPAATRLPGSRLRRRRGEAAPRRTRSG
ncbi:MAG: AI-2E family transporter [Actinomycetota bacterium]|nr:AI-2E family transporter [Actinomycetota bacterium]